MTRILSEAARALYQAAYPVGPTSGSVAFTRWMHDEGLTPRDLAPRLGCTEASIRAWSSGRRVPTIELARRIERLSGIRIESWVDAASSSQTDAA